MTADVLDRVKKTIRSHPWVLGLLISFTVAVFLLILFGANVTFLAKWQLALTDLLFIEKQSSSQIVLVGIDDRSLTALGRWPWPRSTHADLIKRLSKYGAKVVVMDISFSEVSEGQADSDMAKAVKQSGRVVLPVMMDMKSMAGSRGLPEAYRAEMPIKRLEDVAVGLGHVNVYPDDDGVVRSLPMIIQLRDIQYPALSLAALSAYDMRYKTPVQAREASGVQTVAKTIITDPGLRMRINWSGQPGSFRTVSYADVINGEADASSFENKIVLVGITAKAIGDDYMTPVSEGTPMAGVEVHANAINTIINGDFLVQETPLTTGSIIIILALLTGLITSRFRALWSSVMTIGLILTTIVAAVVRFDQGIVANIVYPPFAILITYMATITLRFVSEGQERRKVQSLFGRYVKPEIVKEIVASSERDIVSLKGCQQTITTMFADIRGFTSMSEALKPEEVVAMLNHYLDFITEIIFKHDGTLDKYIGDAAMAFFNAPHTQPDHALRAVKAALEVQARVCELAEDMPEGIACATYGIGINTGEAVVGNIGSRKRHDYTVIGDSVNTASRLCGAAGPGQVIISGSTYEQVKDDIEVEELPPISLKGKEKPMVVYNVKGIKTNNAK